jgi:cytochrome c-type biogenesis protein CcmH
MKILLFLMLSSFLNAESIQDGEFTSPELQKRYSVLIDEIRCPVCQGQSIGGSNAPLAQDLRAAVVKLLKANKTDAEIFDFMRARYGDFVIFKPPVNNQTYLLWIAPFVFVVLAIFFLMRSKKPQINTNTNKEKIDTSRADDLLK